MSLCSVDEQRDRKRCAADTHPIRAVLSPAALNSTAIDPNTHPTPSTPTVREGHVKRVIDEDIQGTVLELSALNIANASIACPADPTKNLGASRWSCKLPPCVSPSGWYC